MIYCKKKYDLVVVGGGPGGIPAAISAARMGIKVLLIEKSGYLGGIAASGLPLLGFIDGMGKKALGGIADEFVKRLSELGGTLGHNICPVHNSITPINPGLFRIVSFEKCVESGVELLLHSEVLDVKIDNKKIKQILVLSCCEKIEIESDIVIDATGDGCIGYLAGASYFKGQDETGVLQPASLIFTVGNVNFDKFLNYIKLNPDEFELPDSYNVKYTFDFFKSAKGYAFTGLKNLIKMAQENNDFNIPRDRFIYATMPSKGEVVINATRALDVDGTNPWDITRGETECHLQILQLLKFMKKYVPGFENIYITSIAPSLGVRETRRIVGRKILKKDVLNEGKIAKDSIALAAYNIDIHHGKDAGLDMINVNKAFGIPYDCLLSKDIEGLIMSGRCISVDNFIFGSTRVMGTCMAIGEAAGTSAGLAIKNGCSPSEVSVEDLRNQLLKNGAILS